MNLPLPTGRSASDSSGRPAPPVSWLAIATSWDEAEPGGGSADRRLSGVLRLGRAAVRGGLAALAALAGQAVGLPSLLDRCEERRIRCGPPHDEGPEDKGQRDTGDRHPCDDRRLGRQSVEKDDAHEEPAEEWEYAKHQEGNDAPAQVRAV